jgi:parvulin-like peptidyl-prolyl isomerase
MLNQFTPSLSPPLWRHPLCRASFVICISILFSGCDKKNDRQVVKELPVLAVVNGEAITSADVDFMLERMLQGQAAVPVDDVLRKKILDSLIASRAMKQQVESQLSTDDLEQIARSVKAYEEELFVKAYLQQFVIPEPVTVEMVQQYYDDHIAEFAGESIREFEILRAPVIADEKLRDRLLAAIPEITAATAWQEKVKEWQTTYNLQYRQGRSQAGVLNKELDQVMDRLQEGQTSDVIYVDGELYLVRVTGIGKKAPKPLTEVGADIRKRLAAQVLREAVKQASEDARAKAKVETLTEKK